MSLMMYAHLLVHQALSPSEHCTGSLGYKVQGLEFLVMKSLIHVCKVPICRFLLQFVFFFPTPQKYCPKPTRVVGCHLHDVMCVSTWTMGSIAQKLCFLCNFLYFHEERPAITPPKPILNHHSDRKRTGVQSLRSCMQVYSCWSLLIFPRILL